MPSKVLLTGVTGFIGSHTTIQLLEKGYEVVGTMRNLDRADDIKKVIAKHTDHIDKLTFAQANLTDADVWSDLMKGVDYVQHIASPFPRGLPKHEDDLIIPAKKGTLNVLKAAAANGVKRVILTSSSAAIAYGKDKDKRTSTFTEKDWTDVNNKKDTTPYMRSKTIAEKAAWDFIKNDASGMELTVICPVAVLGPVLEKDFGTSANIVIKAMNGSSPAVPKLAFSIVDVRSIADANIKAMEVPAAANERFVCSAGLLTFKEIADILSAKYPNKKVPKGVLPNFAVRLLAQIDKTLQPVLINLGVQRTLDSSKAKSLLNWQPIDEKEAVLSCAESVVKLGLV